MKKTIVMLAAMLLFGCEENSITSCGFACKNAGARMVKWSKSDGCVCATPPLATTEPLK